MRCSLLWRRVEANKFADWTQEEFEALVLPNRGSPTGHPTLQSMRQLGASIRLHQPVLSKTMLPSTVDWRGTPADSSVKDQAACGSCWVSLHSLLSLLLDYIFSIARWAGCAAEFRGFWWRYQAGWLDSSKKPSCPLLELGKPAMGFSQ